MAAILVCNDTMSVNIPMQMLDVRIQVQYLTVWKDLAQVLREKIIKTSGILRMQIGNEARYSGKVDVSTFNEEFLKEFSNFFDIGGRHSNRDIIFVTFIGL